MWVDQCVEPTRWGQNQRNSRFSRDSFSWKTISRAAQTQATHTKTGWTRECGWRRLLSEGQHPIACRQLLGTFAGFLSTARYLTAVALAWCLFLKSGHHDSSKKYRISTQGTYTPLTHAHDRRTNAPELPSGLNLKSNSLAATR